jgi:acetylornithine deacetylase
MGTNRAIGGGGILDRAELERAALAAVDPEAIAADLARLIAAASPTGRERPAVEALAEIAAERGLPASVVEHDLARMRAASGYPGEEAPREELLGLEVRLDGSGPRRLCLNGHLDVVGPGTQPWRHRPFVAEREGDRLYGRGSVDMKGGVVAALHAMAAVAAARGPVGVDAPEVVLQAVSSEEDGGLGTFAALERDDRFDACLIPEPSSFDVVVAHGGSLTFTGTIRGVSTHAATRLSGVSAIDRYLPVHFALAEHEHRINAAVAHELMARLELPYPVLVGRLAAGQWSSQVPDELEFEVRLGVPVGVEPGAARRGLERVIEAADDGRGPPIEIDWSGGQFAPAQTPADHPFVGLVHRATREQCSPAAELCGVSYGADMRHFCARGIPCVMLGPPGLERAHAADEWVSLSDLNGLARAIALVILRFERLEHRRVSDGTRACDGTSDATRASDGTGASDGTSA